MKTRFLMLASLLAAACSPAVQDSPGPDGRMSDDLIPYVTPADYRCSPSSFTLDQRDLLDTGAFYELNGTIDMPTPGYTYRVEERASDTFDHQYFSVHFTPPAGMVIQVITPLEINYSFYGSPALQKVVFQRSQNMKDDSLLAECVRL